MFVQNDFVFVPKQEWLLLLVTFSATRLNLNLGVVAKPVFSNIGEWGTHLLFISLRVAAPFTFIFYVIGGFL